MRILRWNGVSLINFNSSEVFMGSCSSCKYDISPGSNCFLRIVLSGRANYFLMKPFLMLMINPVFPSRNWISWGKKNDVLCFSERVKRSCLNHANCLNHKFYILRWLKMIDFISVETCSSISLQLWLILYKSKYLYLFKPICFILNFFSNSIKGKKAYLIQRHSRLKWK